ncbi:MAG: ATP-binding protein [Gammaproteobacteria bacterium]|nr:ATP-binding protein [Gammaproteobacteria bacterium]
MPADECGDLPMVEASPMDYVRMDIIDNGCGMSREEQDRAFEPFFTTKAMNEGTGLGLATVYGVIKQNQGYVFCESEKGVGTSMYVLFPISRRDRGG